VGVAVAGLAVALPARAVELIDEVYKEDFDVQFWGQTVDHKFIIYAIVLGQFVGFVGATVSGLEAKKRKEEVLQLNAKLLGINKELRKLAREGGFVSSSLEVRKEGKESKQVEESRENVISMLRQGKELLRQTDAQGATEHFQKALEAIRTAGDALDSPWKAERKALRGLGAAFQLQGKNKEALKHMMRVLEIVEEHKGEMVETTDTLGVIADIYTDLGDMEQAAVYYDRYLAMLNEE